LRKRRKETDTMLCNIETIDGGDYPTHYRRLRRAAHNGRIVEWSLHRSCDGSFADVICLPSFLAVNCMSSDGERLIIRSVEERDAWLARITAPRPKKARRVRKAKPAAVPLIDEQRAEMA
jgi:hypothetical protein